MKSNHENVDMPDKTFPIRVFLSSSADHHIFVHPHWHDEIEILYMVSGHAMQHINENVFPLMEGDLVIIGSNDVHATYTEQEGRHEILVLQLGIGLIKPMDLIAPESKWIDDFLHNMEFSSSVPVPKEGGMVDLLYAIQREAREKNPAFELFVKSSVYELIGMLAREYRQFSRKRSGMGEIDKSREMLQNTFQLIDAHYQRDLTLIQAAQASNLSVSHFCRLFKRFTGMTFKEYLTLFRISRAEALLMKDKSITEIAYASGFNSIDSFIRAFKRYKRCTPSSYRDR